MPTRPAATVMVVRDGSHGDAPLEVLMLRRNVRSEFVGGAHVFPGGAVDRADGAHEAAEVCSGGDDAAASVLLGLDHGGLAYWVAAVRECFEEAGILLAVPPGGGALSLEDPEASRRFADHRRALNGGAASFAEVCRREGLRVPVDRIHYFAHWITPLGLPRRYDTRFFVAEAPPDQVPAHDAAETVADIWIRPSDALARHRAGVMELILPTVRNLQAIGRFPTAGALLDAAAAARDVPAVTPRMVTDGEGVRLLLPGDAGYDTLPAAPRAAAEVASAAAREAAARAHRSAGSGVPEGPGRLARRPDGPSMSTPGVAGPPGVPPPLPDTGRGAVPVPGHLERVAPLLARVTAPNPGVMTGPGTNTYLVGEGELAVVDPGPDDADHLRVVRDAAEALGGAIRWVLVTHTHADHAPGAATLARLSGAEVIGFGPRQGFAPDRAVGEGWTLVAPSFRLRALHTPGHASDHLCWLLEPHGVLLSGDHVMDGVTVVIAPPDGDMAAYVANLQRLLELDPPLTAIAPGHGRLLDRPAEVVAAVLAHRMAREERVAAALATSGQSTVDELVARVYSDVSPELHGIARSSLWAHLRKLASDGRAEEVGASPVPIYRPVVAPGSAS